MMEFLQKRGNLLLFVIALIFTTLGALKLVDYIVFITTKQQAVATVVKVEKLPMPKPYKVTLVYMNKNVNDNVVTYIDNIGDIYGKRYLEVHNRLNIYYRNYFPREVYLTGYSYPTWSYVAFTVLYLIIMAPVLSFLAKKRHTRIQWV
jgi:hypothetical protein